jgi:hypothetical protein
MRLRLQIFLSQFLDRSTNTLAHNCCKSQTGELAPMDWEDPREMSRTVFHQVHVVSCSRGGSKVYYSLAFQIWIELIARLFRNEIHSILSLEWKSCSFESPCTVRMSFFCRFLDDAWCWTTRKWFFCHLSRSWSNTFLYARVLEASLS